MGIFGGEERKKRKKSQITNFLLFLDRREAIDKSA